MTEEKMPERIWVDDRGYWQSDSEYQRKLNKSSSRSKLTIKRDLYTLTSTVQSRLEAAGATEAHLADLLDVNEKYLAIKDAAEKMAYALYIAKRDIKNWFTDDLAATAAIDHIDKVLANCWPTGSA